ncbi:MAG: exodeoxyribonuclease V subunit gamma, partial [Candidatus Riflebacteria bacterium]|nr:exodeoxyribonuclease V subunit gamma [Candidatus Riflebacteria bacterium]
LGRLGHDFQWVLERHSRYEDRPLYRDPTTRTALGALQAAILDSGNPDGQGPPPAIDRLDGTVGVHSCHSPIRQVEVLRDQLLGLLHDISGLSCDEIVVMTPNLELFGPLIEAVFGADRGTPRYIPHQIADRSDRSESAVLEAFQRLLDVIESRMTASAVFDLMSMDAIRRRFDLDQAGLEQIRSWILDSGIRWGIDPEHRKRCGVEPFAENTWRFGLDRLLLGYAMPSAFGPFRGVLPHDDVEGRAAAPLGCLASFCDRLFTLKRSLEAPRTVESWSRDLAGAFEQMIAVDEDSAVQQQTVLEALSRAASAAAQARFEHPISLAAMRKVIEPGLESGGSARGFLSGGITFCELRPMRSIPFKVVCLLGLSDGEFPRMSHPRGFDLMAIDRRPGDRSLKDEDRYLFLEAILSARERLLITYVGQSIRDNARLPPSVVVSELIDAIAALPGEPEDAKDLEKRLVVRHPLQPFSPRYFVPDRDPRLFSFVRLDCAGARSLLAPRRPAAPFLDSPLPEVDPDRSIELDELIRFFGNPARAILSTQLGLKLTDPVELLIDREPLAIDGLARYELGTRLVHERLEGHDWRLVFERERASGRLPPGALGQVEYVQLVREVDRFAQAVSRGRGTRLAACPVRIALDDASLVGRLDDLFEGGQVLWRFSRIKATLRLALWIRHLALNAAGSGGIPPRSRLLVRSDKVSGVDEVELDPVDDATGRLADLVRLFLLGQRVPLPFFPESSLEYASRLRSGRPEDGSPHGALARARQRFESDFGGRGSESTDPYVQKAFGVDPLGDAGRTVPGCAEALSFEALAVRVFGPFLEQVGGR